MTESAHVTMNRVLNEPEFGYDTVRIIANDCRALDAHDRKLLLQAADELEGAYRFYASMAQMLVEERQKNQALTDALREARKTPFVSLEHQFTVPLPKLS